MKKKHYARYNEEGCIIGLYNNKTHKDIPEPRIAISESEYEAILRCPTRWRVRNNNLLEVKNNDVHVPRSIVEGIPFEDLIIPKDKTTIDLIFQSVVLELGATVLAFKNREKQAIRLSADQVKEVATLIQASTQKELG